MSIVKKILYLLNEAERRSAMLLLAMLTLMALLDTIGIASILPFMAVLTDISVIETNTFVNSLFEISRKLGIKNTEQFLFLLGVLVFILLILSLSFKALTYYVQTRFIKLRSYSIGKKLINGYLNQPYSWFLSQHTADFEKNILSEVDQVVDFGINSLLELISKTLVSLALIILVLMIDPKLTLIVGFTLSLAYLLIYLFVKNYLARSGEERLLNNKLRFITVSEAFGAIKEIKVRGLEKTYLRSFKVPSRIFATTQAFADVISLLPRFFLEAIAFGGVILLILSLMHQKGNFNDVIPLISVYVFVGYRLMPSLQSIYACFANLAFVEPSLSKLSNDLKNLQATKIYTNKQLMPFKEKISLEGIKYYYPNSSRSSINNITLTIPVRSTVGIVGVTGSGKTTIVDIILGLLEPQSGYLKVDEKIINKENVRSWQQNIGYVPQHIYLSDDTVAANIAFGVNHENVDLSLVHKVAKIACIHDFIMNELNLNYHTKIGERGVRLSGGQRQRIGIARALYHSPSLLILDEATSALDTHTEERVMDSIYSLSDNITIILIAHRLKTVKNCNRIFLLAKGQLEDQGTFDDLKKNQSFFKDNSSI